MVDHPRFISDVMLGRLTRWLRILGFDTVYFRTINDNELIKIARQQERTLLTRDTGIAGRLSQKKILEFILIRSNNTFEQIKEVLAAFNPPSPPFNKGGELSVPSVNKGGEFSGVSLLSPPLLKGGLGGLQSRCTLCNGELTAADREEIANRIPEYVFLNATSFFTCKDCGKVYWYGSHRKSIDSILKQVIGQKS